MYFANITSIFYFFFRLFCALLIEIMQIDLGFSSPRLDFRLVFQFYSVYVQLIFLAIFFKIETEMKRTKNEK